MAKASGSSCGSGEDQAERNRRIGPLWTPSSPGMPSHHRAGADGTERHCVRCGGVLCLILPKIRLPLFLREIGYRGNRGARARRRSRTLRNAVSASAGIRTPGRPPVDLPVMPGSAGIHGSIRGGDESGGEDQGRRNRRVEAL